MKLVSLLGFCITFTLSSMDRPEHNVQWFTYLVDVEMDSLCIPAPAQQPAPTPPTNAPVNPGMLQALHNELSTPSDKANK